MQPQPTMMRFPIPILIVSVLLLASFGGTSALAQSSDWKGACRVTFSGKSTLHPFEGKVDAEPFTVSIQNFDTPAKAKASANVVVKVAKMDTDNEKRDVEMRKSLDAATYPEIRVSVKDLVPEATSPRMNGEVPQPTVIPFQLGLKGKTLSVKGRVSDWSYADDQISCTISFPVSLAAAGIKPPSVLGLVKVKDEISVTARLKLTH